MTFVDEIDITTIAGNGGNGVERWLNEKGKEFGGPAGGNGGNGGNVYARAVRDINILSKYRGKSVFEAAHGGAGQSRSMHGKDGQDLFVDLPVGAILTNTKTGEVFELVKEGQEVLLASGGRGGLGNEHFKSSRNINPREWTAGKPGEHILYDVVLALFADAGFVGFPNAGKSSLLNTLTHAQAKVAHYKFTTLDPNLGDFYGFILADIPGLIAGAADGKGLGHKFLRHITRTKVILHCISLESEDSISDYQTIRKELTAYNSVLTTKKEVILLTKSDTVSDEYAQEMKSKLEQETTKPVHIISILNTEQLKSFSNFLVTLLREGE
jgi:GTP-binding protein